MCVSCGCEGVHGRRGGKQWRAVVGCVALNDGREAYVELKGRWWSLRVTAHAPALAASRTATHTRAAAALLADLHPRLRRYNCAHALASAHCWPTLARPHLLPSGTTTYVHYNFDVHACPTRAIRPLVAEPSQPLAHARDLTWARGGSHRRRGTKAHASVGALLTYCATWPPNA